MWCQRFDSSCRLIAERSARRGSGPRTVRASLADGSGCRRTSPTWSTASASTRRSTARSGWRRAPWTWAGRRPCCPRRRRRRPTAATPRPWPTATRSRPSAWARRARAGRGPSSGRSTARGSCCTRRGCTCCQRRPRGRRRCGAAAGPRWRRVPSAPGGPTLRIRASSPTCWPSQSGSPSSTLRFTLFYPFPVVSSPYKKASQGDTSAVSGNPWSPENLGKALNENRP